MKQDAVTETQPLPDAPTIAVGEDNSVFTSLAATLTEIRKLKGVVGYILRSNTAAIVDLPQPETPEYAMLSAQVSDSSKGIAKQFNLTDVESVLVEGKTHKLLCIRLGENKIGIFMEKTCAHAWIVKRILL
ncbi:MAG: roadblock/LC7 domain-containing protein [Candidatus Bathyarchaeota archaeon]|nr:roadblock/LC7 domain-containing protein [Candidatus Bathyarchaeota archaeon]